MRFLGSRRRFSRFFALALAVMFLLLLTPHLPATVTTYAESLEDLQDEYDNLEDEQKAIKDKLAALGNSVSDAKKRAEYLEEQIAATEQQLEVLEDQIALQNTLLQENTQKLNAAEERIAGYEEQCLKRLRASYANSTVSDLAILLESGSFTEFLLRAEYLRVTTKYDNALLDQLRKDKQEIAEARVAIEEKKKSIEAAQASAATKQKNLVKQYEDKLSNIESIYRTEAELKERQKKITAQMDKLNEEIQDMISSSANSGEYVGGDWSIPLDFRGWWFSSYYGWRTLYGVPDFHTGIDFTGGGIYGAPVLAANAGTVYYTKPAAGDRTGYGNHIMIDHGGGNFTLYAHLATINVVPGQVVTRGQKIGEVGSTGNSTGPHLHFELYINKVRVNPYSYLMG